MGQSADSTFIDEPVPPVEIVKADTIIYQEPSLITTKIRAGCPRTMCRGSGSV